MRNVSSAAFSGSSAAQEAFVAAVTAAAGLTRRSLTVALLLISSSPSAPSPSPSPGPSPASIRRLSVAGRPPPEAITLSSAVQGQTAAGIPSTYVTFSLTCSTAALGTDDPDEAAHRLEDRLSAFLNSGNFTAALQEQGAALGTSLLAAASCQAGDLTLDQVQMQAIYQPTDRRNRNIFYDILVDNSTRTGGHPDWSSFVEVDLTFVLDYKVVRTLTAVVSNGSSLWQRSCSDPTRTGSLLRALVLAPVQVQVSELKQRLKDLFLGVFSEQRPFLSVLSEVLIDRNRFLAALAGALRAGLCLSLDGPGAGHRLLVPVLHAVSRLGCLGFLLALFLSSRYPPDDGSCAASLSQGQCRAAGGLCRWAGGGRGPYESSCFYDQSYLTSAGFGGVAAAVVSALALLTVLRSLLLEPLLQRLARGRAAGRYSEAARSCLLGLVAVLARLGRGGHVKGSKLVPVPLSVEQQSKSPASPGRKGPPLPRIKGQQSAAVRPMPVNLDLTAVLSEQDDGSGAATGAGAGSDFPLSARDIDIEQNDRRPDLGPPPTSVSLPVPFPVPADEAAVFEVMADALLRHRQLIEDPSVRAELDSVWAMDGSLRSFSQDKAVLLNPRLLPDSHLTPDPDLSRYFPI
eukprot:gene19387-19802_t